MTRRLNRILTTAVAVLVGSAFGVSQASTQDGSRFRVLIPDFFPLEEADKDFGEDVAKELRELMDELPTHAAIDKDDIEDELDRLDMDMEDLNCVFTRQLGNQMNAQVAICASYTEADDQRQIGQIEVWDLGSLESFEIDGFQAHKDDKEEAAQQIFTAFDNYVQQLRHVTFCSDYVASQDWESALRQCEQALELNPMSASTLHQKAFILQKMERLEEALETLEQVLEIDQFRDNSLQLAGYIATQLGRQEDGREYYGRYLQLNPGDVAVRRSIAYDIYEAGDPEGAMLFIREGLEVEENPDLWQDYGSYAFAAANSLSEGGQNAEITPEQRRLLEQAIEAYLKVFDVRGSEMEVRHLRNVVAAHVQLDQVQDAITVAEQVLEAYPEEATLWNTYAQALRKADRTDEAVEALSRVEQLDPDFPNVRIRQANMLMAAGRFDDALPFLTSALETGTEPDRVARMILAEAHSNGVQTKNYDYAIRLLETANDIDGVSREQDEELNFWLGYAVFQKAYGIQTPNTLQSAQRSLPLFQRARRLFQSATSYGQRVPGTNLQQLLENTGTFIEIQEAIIKRGR